MSEALPIPKFTFFPDPTMASRLVHESVEELTSLLTVKPQITARVFHELICAGKEDLLRAVVGEIDHPEYLVLDFSADARRTYPYILAAPNVSDTQEDVRCALCAGYEIILENMMDIHEGDYEGRKRLQEFIESSVDKIMPIIVATAEEEASVFN